jgi:nucleoside-diphosphate-sugar epimerase
MRGHVRAFRPDVVLHLAAQVAVTTSVADPREDFAINAFGTFNVLEAIRFAVRLLRATAARLSFSLRVLEGRS